MPHSPILVEACCETLEEVRLSVEAGAHRIEFCRDLSCGGLTPPEPLLTRAVRAVRVPVFALIRSRAGDFVFTPEDRDQMLEDVAMARRAGAQGVVVGALRPDRTVDISFTRAMVEAADGLSVTFHKAFDETPSPERALEACGKVGVSRVLTSGGHPSAWMGRDMLARLTAMSAADPSIPGILVGGGVRADHLWALVDHVGAAEVHARALAIEAIMATLGEEGQRDL